MEDIKKIQEFFSKSLEENIVVRMYNTTDKTADLYKEDNPGLEFYLTGKEGQDYVRKYKDHISFPFSSHMNDGTPIPNYEENKEKLAAYLKQKGIPFKTTSAKPYRGVSRTTGEDFMYTTDTFKVPLSHVDIKDISLEENTFKKGDKVTYLGNPAEITFVGKDQMDRVYYSVSYDKGNGKTKASNLYNKGGEIKPLKEEEKSFTDYDNKELAAYCKNNPTDKKAAAELHKRSQKLKDLSRTDESVGEDPIDTITMDVPLFIRVLEYAREDAQADMDLHDLAEKAISLGKERGILQMDDYDEIVGTAEKINETRFSKPTGSPYEQKDLYAQELFGIEYFNWLDFWEQFHIVQKYKLDRSIITKEGKEAKLTEAYVPSNIKEFAKRKGVSSLVNKVAGWAEKVGARITGGTAIGKNYDTLILDMGYQTSDIRIDCEDETIELYDEPIYSFADFKRVFMEEESRKQAEHDEETLRREQGLEEMMSLDDQAKAYYLAKVKSGEIDTLPEDPKAAFLAQMMKDQIDHDEETLRRERGLEEVVSKVISKIKEDRPGLWANIHAQRKRGEKPARKGSKDYKAAVKAGKEINKQAKKK